MVRVSAQFGTDNAWGIDDVSDEAITQLRKCLNIARRLSRVVEDNTDFFDCIVEALIEVDKGVGRPERPVEFLAGDELPWVLEKYLQDTEGLRGKLDSGAVVEQFLSRQGNVKSIKADYVGLARSRWQDLTLPSSLLGGKYST